MIKVKALKSGYYNAQRRRVGDVFEIENEKERGSWMGDINTPIIEKAAMPLTSNVKGTRAAGNVYDEPKPVWEEPVGESRPDPMPEFAEPETRTPVKRKSSSRSGKSRK